MKKIFNAIAAGLLFSAILLGAMAFLLVPLAYIESHYGFREGLPYTVGWVFFVLTTIYSISFYFIERK